MVLKTRDAPLVTVQGAHELTRTGRPHLKQAKLTQFRNFQRKKVNLDGPVSAGRDDVLVVKVDDVHSRAVPHQHPPQVDLSWAHHVPHLKSREL